MPNLSAEGNLRTSDQLGKPDSTTQILIPLYSERVVIQELPTQEYENAINDAFYLDHSVNGLLDDASLTLDGTLTAETPIRIILPNNIGWEYFRDTVLKDATFTTADWDTTEFQVVFDAAEILQTSSAHLDEKTVTQIKVTILPSRGITTHTLTSNLGSIAVDIYERES